MPINVSVVCADELSTSVKNRPQSFVVNTDSCGKPGQHWTAFHFLPKGPAEFSTLWDKPQIITTYAFEKYSSQTDPHTYTWRIEFKLGIPTSADIFVSISFYSDIGEEPWRPSAVTFSSVVNIITMHLCEFLYISKTIRVF